MAILSQFENRISFLPLVLRSLKQHPLYSVIHYDVTCVDFQVYRKLGSGFSKKFEYADMLNQGNYFFHSYWKSRTLKAGLTSVYLPSSVICGHTALPLLVSYRRIDGCPTFPIGLQSQLVRLLMVDFKSSVAVCQTFCSTLCGYTLLKA